MKSLVASGPKRSSFSSNTTRVHRSTLATWSKASKETQGLAKEIMDHFMLVDQRRLVPKIAWRRFINRSAQENSLHKRGRPRRSFTFEGKSYSLWAGAWAASQAGFRKRSRPIRRRSHGKRKRNTSSMSFTARLCHERRALIRRGI